MRKRLERTRRKQNAADIGICFEPLEPRLLLSGGWGAAVVSLSPDPQTSSPGAFTPESVVFCENTIDLGTDALTQNQNAPETGPRVDILALAPALDEIAPVDPAHETASSEGKTTPANSDTQATPVDHVNGNPSNAEPQHEGTNWPEVHELVFVSDNVTDYQQLIADLQGKDDNRIIEVVALDADRDGIEQVSHILADRSDLAAVHFITHGADGQINLGNNWLNSATLEQKRAMVSGWGNALGETGDILFYGCNIAADSTGQGLLDRIADLTGADVAASDDLTGSARLAGDWQLEYTRGEIETSVPFSLEAQQNWSGVLATFTVNTTDDTVDANPGDNLAEDDSGNTSLRAAIMEANALAGADSIVLGAGTYTFSLGPSGDDSAARGDLDITDQLTITGASAAGTIIDGNALDRVFDLRGNEANLTLADLTVQGGRISDKGGGIYIENNGGQLTALRVVITGNFADDGAGIFNEGNITLTDVVISNNGDASTNEGGGIHTKEQAVLDRVTISGNQASDGGGIHNDNTSAILSLTNVTISGNTASGEGGGLHTQKPVTIVNSTFTMNNAVNGGGISNNGGTVNILNTIVAANSAITNPDVQGTFNSLGFNLIENATGGGGFIGSDITGVGAQLGALADNGGFTQTHALLSGSPAINAGTATGAPAVDQRGLSRDAAPDIGAFESVNNTLIVDTTNDVVDGNTSSVDALLGNKGADGHISLREAIIATNNTVSADEIILPAGTYVLTIAGAYENAAATGDLDITDDLIITGAGKATTIIDGGGIDRVFHTMAGVTADMSGLTLQNGDVGGDSGGGMYLQSGSTVTLAGVIIGGNSADSGGGIYNSGTLTITDTEFTGNSAKWGGGLFNNSANATFERVTLSGNTVSQDGGGIYNFGVGTILSLTNVTLSGNTATGNGGGLFTNRPANVTNSTIADNLGGRGIYASGSGDAVLKNTILYNNTGGNANKTLTSLGNNIDSGNTAGLSGPGDMINTDPLLGALANNGGQTKTHALLPGSLAINAGTAAGAPLVDQRGVSRDAAPDIGAYEALSNVLIVDTTSNTADGNTSSISALVASKGLDGHISLREAIMAANNTPNLSVPDVILFDIPGAGPHSIVPGSALPAITEAVVIDGWSEPDFAGVPVIELNGTSAGGGANGLRITGSGVTIRGLVINRFGSNGILITGPGGNVIEGNYVGTNVAGSADLGNSLDGILIDNSPNNVIGGTSAAERNIISGNNIHGIRIIGASSTNNTIQGNYIGLNAAGSGAVGNTYNGIWVATGAGNNLIGGTAPGAGNVISGNADTGLEIQDSNSSGNRIEGNIIGLNAAGTGAIGNLDGVIIEDAPNNTIGGATSAHRNVISGNTGGGMQGNGVVIFGTNATGNLVRNNFIGTDVTGTLDQGNVGSGVLIIDNGDGGVFKGGARFNAIRDNVLCGNNYSGVSIANPGANNNYIVGNNIGVDATGVGALGNSVFGVVIWNGANGNQIGDITPGDGNVIAYNNRGVVVDANFTSSMNNAIRGNSIYSNTLLGIDLRNDGVTFNDPGDGDLGPNGLRNYPVITGAVVTGTDLNVSGTLNSLGFQNHDIDFYWSVAGDPSLHGEGQTYIESTNVTTNGSGNASFDVIFYGVSVPVDAVITCTATDASGNTSEFSENFIAISGNQAPVINDQALSVDENAANSTVVGTVAASDPDAGDTLTYVIAGGNTGGAFAINPSTGQITVNNSSALDYETTPGFGLTVEVTDSGTPSLTDTATVTINLNPINEVPVVNDQSFGVNENAANGTVVGTVAASDPDAGDSFSYAITAGNSGGAFAINPANGQITVNSSAALDYETTPTFNLTVEVTDSGTPGLTDTAAVTINLNPLNEAPVVTDQSFSVDENATNGTVVGTVVASDPDAGDTLNYAITGGNTGGAFAINASTGQITVNNSSALDYETTPSFSLTVEVTDSGTPVLTDTATVTVNLNNLNDTPVINAQSFNVNENTTNGTVVGTVVASDSDAGDSLGYAITAGNTGSAFAINASTGEITVNNSGALNFETTPTFNLTVQVTDSGTPGLTDTATVTINLNDINEAPVVNDQSFGVDENAPNSTVVGTVVASDVDTGDTLGYTITGGNTGGAFSINASTGEITVNNSGTLDFETTPTFDLTVQVTDSGTPGLTDTAMVTIDLNPINEVPVVNDQSFGVNENAANGTVVGTVAASDPDAGDSLSYAITAGNTGGAFAINPANGQVTVNNSAALDFETTPIFNLTVEVTDSGTPGLTDTAAITISLNDLNENPVVSDQSFNVNENATNGTVVGTVAASDLDTGDMLTYAITGGNTGSAFAINTSTGQITVNNSSALDYETTPSFSLTVEVTDTGTPGLTDTATVTVSLNDLNESPVINDQSFNINENATNGTVVGIVAASDPDAGDSLTYAITGGNTGSAFAINASNGQVTVNNSSALDYETTPSFSLTVEVTDSGTPGLTDTATVTIDLNDLNEGPTVNDQSFSVDENATNGTSVGTVAASDLDAGDTLTYAITGGNTGGAFAINASTGQITVNNSPALDYETIPSFSLTIEVTDSGTPGLTDTATVTINLNALNEIPVINDQSFNVNENAANGTVVGTVVASDPDAGDSLTYSITAGNAGSAFAINASTGEITVNNSGALDYETTPTFNLTVEVTDTGTPGLTDTAAVTVNLNDLNENPVVNDQSFSVDENATNGTVVGTVVASDPDAGDTLTYGITAGNTGGAFAINAASGEITVNNSVALDYETTPTFSLTVEVTDSGTPGLTDTATVTINLNAVNEAPVINNQSFGVNENAPNGTVVGTVVASDLDAGDTLTYAITGGNTGSAFAIAATTGQITVNNSSALDYETTPTFSLTVQVNDSGTPGLTDTATVTINLNALNESPVVNDQSFSLNENAANGTVVGTVVASDLDAGDTLTFAITAGNTGSAFAINASTGQITVNNSGVLDFETTPTFGLTVEVTDSGAPGLTDTAVVTINLNEQNDNAPVITAGQGFTLPENAANGTVLGTIVATDVDTVGSLQNWTITGGNTDGIFAIDPNTGEITVLDNTHLDFETTSSYTLTMTVSDGVNNSAPQTVTIDITDTNEAGVGGIGDTDGAADEVAENGPVGTTVGITAHAVDTDGGDTVSYSLDDDGGGRFAIDPNTGVITTTAVLDAEVAASHDVTVRATSTDGSFSTRVFTIDVMDQNDNTPVITAGQSFGVSENAADGASVGTVAATDPDTVGSLQNWTITGGNTDGIFAINPDTGGITVLDNTHLDFETTPSYTLTLTVSDGVNTSAPQTVTVDVTSANEAPAVDDATFNVDENAANGTIVGSVSASDPDAGDTLTYNITAGNTSGAFAINASNGQITVANASALNYEATPTFNLAVQVTDSGTPGLTDTATVTINLNALNEAPVINDQSFNVDENSANGTVVGTVVASDPDAGDTLTYAITGGNTGSAFAINANTGEITVNNATTLNFESTPTFNLTVEVTDSGTPGLTDTATVAVNLNGSNDAPVGTPVITGTVAEDQTLTADTSGISDADGLGAFNYQWLRDGAAIAGATASTYTLGDADVDTQISVQVSYTDGQGTLESLTSEQVGPVANVNDAPVGAPIISGTAQEDQTLTADTSKISDGDGLGPFSFQWLRDGVAIAGANASTYTLGDEDVGAQISVQVSYTDGHGTSEGPLTSARTAPVTGVSNPGTVAIDNLTPTQGDTLTASVSDPDGPTGAISYQWYRDGEAIAGATASTYTLGDADVGAQISVTASYTDGHGTAERLTSAQTGAVTKVTDPGTGDIDNPAELVEPQNVPLDTKSPQSSLPEHTDASPKEPDKVSEQEETPKEEAAEEDVPEESNPLSNQVSAQNNALSSLPIKTDFRSSTLPASRDATQSDGVRTVLNDSEESMPNRTENLRNTEVTREERSNAINRQDLRQEGPLSVMRARDYDYLRDSLDAVKKEMTSDNKLSKVYLGSAIVSSIGLSVGYVVWLLRGGMLLASLLSSMPAWQYLDPLPILARKKEDDHSDDNESLESIIDKEPRQMNPKKKSADAASDAEVKRP